MKRYWDNRNAKHSLGAKPNLASIAGRLKAERCRIGLRHQHAAWRAEVTKHTLSAWERGFGKPTIEYLEVLAEHGVDIVYVVTGEPGGSFQRRTSECGAIEAAQRALAILPVYRRRDLLLKLLAAELDG